MRGRTSRPRPTAGPAVGRRRGPREPAGRRSTGESSRRRPARGPRRAGSRPRRPPSDRRRFSRSLPAIAPTTASGAPDAERARAAAPRANPSDSNGAHVSVSGAANGSSRRSAIPLASKKSAARRAGGSLQCGRACPQSAKARRRDSKDSGASGIALAPEGPPDLEEPRVRLAAAHVVRQRVEEPREAGSRAGAAGPRPGDWRAAGEAVRRPFPRARARRRRGAPRRHRRRGS